MTHPDMLEWQYRQILIELDQLQRHGADPDCPCSQAGMGEFCLSKHAVALHGLAQETMAMAPEGEQAELARLAEEALEWHLKFKDALCRPEDTSGIVEWARKWRKEAIEPIYYACKTALPRKGRKAPPAVAVAAPKGFPDKLDLVVDTIHNLRCLGMEKDEALEKAKDLKRLAKPIVEREWRKVFVQLHHEKQNTEREVRQTREARVHKPSLCSIEGIARTLSFPPDRELVYALLLDKPSRKGRVLGIYRIGSGGLVSSPVSVAGLLMAAQGVGAKAAVLVHNHPSGEAEPSEEDVETTRRIQREARKHGFVITDHLIVANGTVRSMLPRTAVASPKKKGPPPEATYACVLRFPPGNVRAVAKRIRKEYPGCGLSPGFAPGTLYADCSQRIDPKKLGKNVGGKCARAKQTTLLQDVIPSVRIQGLCGRPTACQIKVIAKEEVVEKVTSITELPHIIAEVQRRLTERQGAATVRTFAIGPRKLTRYEFQYRIAPVKTLKVSHDPDTFVPNPDYPPELQPRQRERAATRIQVEKMAAGLDPDALLTEYHSIDRGTPIVGPDAVVESGNGRVMALLLASRDFPDSYRRYQEALQERIMAFGLKGADLQGVEVPILVRERLTEVARHEFAQEANAGTTIEMSAIERARTDAARLSLTLIQGLAVAEGQAIEDALRSTTNRGFVQNFLAKLPAEEQARLVDAKGVVNQEGIRRLTLAIFVRAFPGDVGLRLAENFFEALDIEVRNVFSGILRALGPMVRAESLAREGQREPTLSISDDLARAVTVYASVKKTPGATVEKYLVQAQLFTRELSPFQERILRFLDEHARSAKRIAAVLADYARRVEASPPPQQATMVEYARARKEDIFETALRALEEPERTEGTQLLDVAANIAAAIRRIAAAPLVCGQRVVGQFESAMLKAHPASRA